MLIRHFHSLKVQIFTPNYWLVVLLALPVDQNSASLCCFYNRCWTMKLYIIALHSCTEINLWNLCVGYRQHERNKNLPLTWRKTKIWNRYSHGSLCIIWCDMMIRLLITINASFLFKTSFASTEHVLITYYSVMKLNRSMISKTFLQKKKCTVIIIYIDSFQFLNINMYRFTAHIHLIILIKT